MSSYNVSVMTFSDEDVNNDSKLTQDDQPSSKVNKVPLSIQVCEVRESDFSLFIWPGGEVLGWFLWRYPHFVVNKRVLEIGAGVSVPSLVALKLGAAHVTITDRSDSANDIALANAKQSVLLNGFDKTVATLHISPSSSSSHKSSGCFYSNGVNCSVTSLDWGDVSYTRINSLLAPSDSNARVNVVLGADCFYSSESFEDILATVYVVMYPQSARDLVEAGSGGGGIIQSANVLLQHEVEGVSSHTKNKLEGKQLGHNDEEVSVSGSSNDDTNTDVIDIKIDSNRIDEQERQKGKENSDDVCDNSQEEIEVVDDDDDEVVDDDDDEVDDEVDDEEDDEEDDEGDDDKDEDGTDSDDDDDDDDKYDDDKYDDKYVYNELLKRKHGLVSDQAQKKKRRNDICSHMTDEDMTAWNLHRPLFITTYQERSSNRNISSLLLKWNMKATSIPLSLFMPINKLDSDSRFSSISLLIIEPTKEC